MKKGQSMVKYTFLFINPLNAAPEYTQVQSVFFSVFFLYFCL